MTMYAGGFKNQFNFYDNETVQKGLCVQTSMGQAIVTKQLGELKKMKIMALKSQPYMSKN